MTDNINEFSEFAETVYKHKYAIGKETWQDIALRVARVVAMGDPQLEMEFYWIISRREFMPGGRYLYAAGRRIQQMQNCLLLRADDSREGWAELCSKAVQALMTGAGIGVDYSAVRPNGAPISGSGGTATGPLALMQMINEIGRGIMQGGSRRSAIWAGLSWRHKDIFDFIKMKEWSEPVAQAKRENFNSPAPMDGTNISVLLDDEFFEAFRTVGHPLHDHAQRVYWTTVEHMMRTGEPGFSIDTGENAGETLRNAPVAGDTQVLTLNGYRPVAEIVGTPVTIWTGERWVDDVSFRCTQYDAPIVRVCMTGGRVIRCEPRHEFLVERYSGAGKRRHLVRIDRVAAGELKCGDTLHVSLPRDVDVPQRTDSRLYTLGFLYGDGSFSDGRAELTLCTDDKKACLDALVGYDSIRPLDGRGYTRLYWHRGFDGADKGKAPVLSSVREVCSFLAGVFDADGNWEPQQKRIRLSSKHRGFLRDCARLLESVGVLAHVSKAGVSTFGQAQTYQLVVASEYVERFAQTIPTIRVVPDLAGYTSYRPSVVKVLSVEPDGVEDVYCADVRAEEHSFQAEGVIISNCTEVTSRDDSDICNLGSINLARIRDLDHLAHVTRIATKFLINGTLCSSVPYGKVEHVRSKNRRLGLGLMGIHEWFIQRRLPYGSRDIEPWLEVWKNESDETAKAYAQQLGISVPVKIRAIAPTGTISIVAECGGSGIEPIFCAAYKRRFLVGNEWRYQYVIDPAVARYAEVVPVDEIEDAYSIDPERRVAFQAFVQRYVDHGISSTINLPPWGTKDNNHERVKSFGSMLMRYLPSLRGITCYPDGARGGQPLNPVRYEDVKDLVGETFVESGDICSIRGGGTCGD